MRTRLAAGDLAAASRTARPASRDRAGRVVHGFHRGATTRHPDGQPARAADRSCRPTASTRCARTIAGARFDGVANIGFNPTFGNRHAIGRDASARLQRRSLRPASRDRLRRAAARRTEVLRTSKRCWRRFAPTSPRRDTLLGEHVAMSAEPGQPCVDGNGERHAGMRLDRFLPNAGVLGTRSQVHRLIAAGRVRVAGRAVKPGTALRAGDGSSRSGRAGSGDPCRGGADRARRAATRTSRLLAINKPPGLVVHPAPGHWQGTLVSALLHRWPRPPAGFDPSAAGDRPPPRQGHVGRPADRPHASRAGRARRGSSDEPRDRASEYLALVWGAPRPGTRRDRPADRPPPGAAQAHGREPRGRVARPATRWSSSWARVALRARLSRDRPDPSDPRASRRARASGRRRPLYARAHRVASAGPIARQALHAERNRLPPSRQRGARPSQGAARRRTSPRRWRPCAAQA